MHEKVNFGSKRENDIIVDLRSDTLSKPTPEMRTAMYNTEVGDDVYGEDPTVIKLENKAAELLGKQEALFVASGTMANLIAVMVHCKERGCEIISGDQGHTFKFEQGGTAQIAGVHTVTIKNNSDGTFSTDELRKKIRKSPDYHEPVSSLIVLENTHNVCGGKVLPLEWLKKVKNIAKEYNIPVHMDGARLMNAAVALNVLPSQIVNFVDSVCFCLSKGLGCPVGAILAGTSSFILKARRIRKALGGGWRQAGIIAAAGLVALDKMIDRLQIDHNHAYQIAKGINDLKCKHFRVTLEDVKTNIVILYLSEQVDPKDVQKRLATVLPTDPVKVSVKCSSRDNWIRFVTYWEITDKDIELTLQKISFVLKEFEEKIESNLKSKL
ncbi:hypothetical protein GWI33_008125 [Rhynchophorus ferrugineus]|uniref:Aromatic amino acid beta-eliminating lyase/threonine aldolase domain-containing protein n=1 Tax=Rhynchophorus ferrugineus TaxID=354439 RepID=A0A834IGM1_RHYFE|nr:hypothetical protein GWI33_008125 [Rhynchophorus ferrugineus]